MWCVEWCGVEWWGVVWYGVWCGVVCGTVFGGVWCSVWCVVWCGVCKILSVSGVAGPAYQSLDQAGKLTDPFLQPDRQTDITWDSLGLTGPVLPQLSPGSHSAH